MAALIKKLFVLSSVPLAVGFSYVPDVDQAPVTRPPLEGSKVSSSDSRGLDPETVRSELEALGLDLLTVDAIVGAAQCAGDLAADAHLWFQGMRLTGSLLVPDTAQTLCGYSEVPQWVFRTRMLSFRENVVCAARIHSSGNSDQWIAALRRLGEEASSQRSPSQADTCAANLPKTPTAAIDSEVTL
jgi:hypothetical protein